MPQSPESPWDSVKKPATSTPEIGQCGLLRAVNVTRAGTFMEWKPGQDLLVPVSQQVAPMQKGRSYVIYLLLDPEQKPIGSTKLHRHLKETTDSFKAGQAVSLMIVGDTDLGYKAVINGTHLGLLFRSEVLKPLKPGDTTPAYIKAVRKDRKIDLCLRLSGNRADAPLTERIMQHLQQNGGTSSLTDSSSPDDIYRQYGVSKGNYKKALGNLYRNRRISLGKEQIELLET